MRDLLAAGRFSAAADVIMRELGSFVRRYLRSILRDDADADEAFSSFGEALVRGLVQFRGESAVKTWVLRLAVHEAYDVRTTPWRRRTRRLGTAEASALADEVRGSTAPRLERHRLAVDRLREHLAPEDQALLVMRVDQELSWAEISDVLAGAGEEVSPAALSKRYERIRKRLGDLATRGGLLE
ncbi:MAG TPA: sigma-70 family RNA polymerase sigma factor [Anaeromyxobacteraceae bacterium]|nr:sigma-70 family RNA polymerase sigma factor [Anaeromyxobacteraceae bacterium]